jgi:hypothetical protein
MTRPRYSLAQLMAILVYLRFGFAALRNADEFWATATYSIAVLTIAAAPVGAIARRGAARSTWAGFAVFGWTYLVALELPDWGVGGFGFGPIQKPVLLIEWGITRLQPYVYPKAGGRDLTRYEQVSLSLGSILFGLVGAVLSRILAPKDERPIL